MKHILAIDETGSMTMSADDKSFVCGVLISSNELTIKQKYKQAYEKMKLGTPAPNQMENLIGNKQFHFSEMENFQKNICRELLLPLADKIYVSKGKPTLYANNQNWWLVAVSVVISEFLKDETFESNDEVEILIDNRSDNTFGLIEDDNGNTIDFYAYHKILKEQIERSINTIAKAYNIKLNIKFKADTASFYINLADVVCGFVRIDRNHIKQSIIECPCSKFMSGNNPALFVDNNPMVALTLIFQEVSNAKLNNIGFTAQVIEKLRNNAEYYSLAWDMFYDLVKTKIAERTTNSVLIGIKPFVDIFITEFNHNKTYLSGSKCLELMVLFVEYFSHIGQTESPCKKEDFIKYLQNENEKSETRLLRKWEKLVSFSLRNVQILFNAYNFSEAIADLETLWEEQEKIIKSTSAFIGTEKDEPTTAIIGTLAQSYAYNFDFLKAIEYFEMSKDYAIKTTNRTDSFLFTIYHRLKNIDQSRDYFQKQTGVSPKEYFSRGNFKDGWKLLNYCKLRAMELYIKKTTMLPRIDLQKLQNYNSEYPFPLIQKWEGIALWLENAQSNQSIVETYFCDAVKNLLHKDNGFVLKTLALPIIQCFALVNSQNEFCVQYNNIFNELKKQSIGFEQYTTKIKSLNSIENNENIWQRAILLPFIYA